ncbi:NLP/P60 protein [Deinococcus proteolyticus MRP]|uniref:NLP/P60 protein n=1 Tax=Deinococcus proteolyticus (strain ATCC 35074 / DSM 20540 / JCM 6276 / NBRC 101906 / NCIMB 13154 / VKM Ac-1939 / CCM 2703 / MRP) TaxID=693977 RepID=F0RKU3_DEIPM|nr:MULTISPECIES: LysM peptidoglycan-binding domain-containing C40 family peptidase [Deinococcus]ADY26805.1 NLP/P60 protein [Deinococcus proteolyticus MRP]MCY1702926.1 peptidoglycan endopeptidase [Deinococcus sp. SL84]
MKALRTLLLSIAAVLATTASAGSYTVKAGDTLYKIAQAHGMGTQQLMQANGLNSTTIEIGQRLQVTGEARSVGPTVNAAGTGSATVRTAASRFLGIPYRLGGNGRGSVDCSAYTQLVFRNMGISLPRTALGQWRTGYAVSSRNLRAGDLVFFNTTGRGVSHVGIYLGGDQMANANSYYGRSMVERMFGNSYWASRYVGARRVM